MNNGGEKPYIEAILNSDRKLYEQMFLYQLEKMESIPVIKNITTFEEFKVYMQRDMKCMMGVLMAQCNAQEGIIAKFQGGADASIYDEEEELMDNLCRDGTKYVDIDEEVGDDDVDGDQEDDDRVDCDDEDDDDDGNDDGHDSDESREEIEEMYRQFLGRVGL